MNDNNNIQQSPDFSGIPSLGDVQGLQTYLNNQALAQQGLPVQQEQPAAPAAAPASNSQPTDPAQPAAAPAQPVQPATNAGDTVTFTKEQLQALIAGRGQAPAQPTQPVAPVQRTAVYNPQQQQFISRALAQGYSLDQINTFLKSQQATQIQNNSVMEQKVNQIEQYLRAQEYKQAETAFINKLSDFGNKWGLSEQDLVTFGQEALKNGINISQENINLEMVFKAVYPDQYAIRSRRMTPTNSSQIYGGSSIPETNRATTSKLEDAYVDAFLKSTMPNQFAAYKK